MASYLSKSKGTKLGVAGKIGVDLGGVDCEYDQGKVQNSERINKIYFVKQRTGNIAQGLSTGVLA